MCTFNTASGCDCRCMCDVLPAEDRDKCPEHGTQKTRPVSVGRTQPLWDVHSCSSALDKIEKIVDETMLAGEFSNRQLSIMRWAVGKCRSLAGDLCKLDVAEL